jgi:acyl-coenzyme A synthetase/AMP-(fatty) acid ligase
VQAWLGFEKHNLVRVVLHTHFEMEIHVETLNDIEASVLVFDTGFTKEVDTHRGSLTTVRHFVAIGRDVPEWAVPFDDVKVKGSSEEVNLDVDEDAPCFLQLTTGTTGKPKPWIKSYRSWHSVISHNLHHLDTFGPDTASVGPDDVNLHFHPVQWASGFQTLYPYLVRGARTVLMDDSNFDPENFLDVILNEGVTGVLIPGPLMVPILDAVEARGGIEHKLQRVVIFFATPEMLNRTTELLGPVWCHGFGSTEQGAVTTRLLAYEVAEKSERLNSVGRAGSPFFECAIVDDNGSRLGPGKVGEIVVRSGMSIGSYWGMPDKTRGAFFPGDWFRPFDVGYMDEDGFLYYADRLVDRIVASEGVVYPHLVESAVMKHQAVANCGVVGLGELDSQDVVAAVLLKEGSTRSVDLEKAIITTANEGLKAYERLSRIIFVDELPTVLGGAKVQRHTLREILSA